MPGVVKDRRRGRPRKPTVPLAIREQNAFLGGKRIPRGRCSPPVSPWETALRYEYERAGLHQWNNAKVFQVCQIFRCTLHELCGIAGLFDDKKIGELRRANLWPMMLTIQWQRLVDFKLGLRGVQVQDALAAKGLVWREDEEKAA